MDTYGRYMMVDELDPGTTYLFSVSTRKDDKESAPVSRTVTTGNSRRHLLTILAKLMNI